LRLAKLEADLVSRRARRVRSIRQFITYLGPTLIVSMAYMDPGNYGTGIQAGAIFNYDLLWSVWAASLFAMVLQYLSGKLGIATNHSLPELLRTSLKKRRYIIPYWLGAEIAAAATDLAEYLGTVIALNILFGIPLLYAAIFGAFDVLILLALTSRKFKVLEHFFLLFVSIISFGFLYESIVIRPSINEILVHSVSITVDQMSVLAVVGIIGATVMPHVLFLHSDLTKTRAEGATIEEKRSLRRLHRNEVVVILGIAALVNVAILVTAAAAFYPKYQNISTINQAYDILVPLFGKLAAVIFAITLLSSGLASSITGTLAGISIMNGLLGVSVNVTLRRIVTRFINVFPTTIAILLGINPLALLVYSQIFLSILIPLPMIPLLIYTSRRGVMGEFVNRHATTIVASLVALVIIVLNVYLILTSV